MIGPPAAPGLCQGTASKRARPVQKSTSRKHSEHRPNQAFGDYCRSKSDDVFRFLYMNLRGIGMTPDGIKTVSLKRTIDKYGVDVVGMSENNVDWGEMDVNSTLWGRFKGEYESVRIAAAHNTTSSSRHQRYQPGGTALMAVNRISHCVSETGVDSRRLGRWTWMKIAGSDGVVTRVVSVYCPCRSSSGDYTAYQQQRRRFRNLGIKGCPIKQFWKDLVEQLTLWKQQGDQLLVGGDWNTPIREVTKKLSYLRLTELITSKHGLDRAPNTHINGSAPIDGIFASSTLSSVQCGYLPFNKGVITDHRLIWVDLLVTSVVGFRLDHLQTPPARKLQLRDPRIEQRYLESLKDHMTRHKIEEKTDKLLKQSVYPLPPKLQAKMEALDKLQVEGMRYAEKRCRKFRKGRHKWSPQFKSAYKKVVLWTMVRQRCKGVLGNTRRIICMMRKYGIPVREYSIEEAEAELQAAWKVYGDVKKEAASLRTGYLESLARSMEELGNAKASSALKALANREEQRDMAKAIKFTVNKLFGTGISRIKVPNGESGWREVTDRHELEQLILHENTWKYHQAEAYCPLLSGTLLDDIGLCGEGPAVQSILDGTYVPPLSASKGTKLFLRHMCRPNLSQEALDHATHSSPEEYARCWKRKKERTSSSGPLHYAHYKAGCKDEMLLRIHFNFAEICFVSGYTLRRHKEGIDCELLKCENDIRLHRLRTICLFDAEFNMNNARIGSSGTRSGLVSGQIAHEQYSRPSRAAIDHVLNRRLSFEYFGFRKEAFAMCSCDLKGNYDRIVHNAASLALQRLGVPLSRIHGMFDTLQRMVKRLRTAHGESAQTYGGDNVPFPFLQPPQGVFQGNAIGPPVWTIISSTIFAALRSEGFGVKFISAVSEEVFNLCGFAYVDDTDLIQSGQDVFKVASELKEAHGWWEDLMQVTGQAMAPEKSWWYLVEIVWKNGKWIYNSAGEHLDLVAHDDTGKPISLKRLVHSKATKMLGVYLSPDGNKDEEIKYLSTKTNQWADCIRSGHLGALATWIATSSYIWKSIQYPLPVTTFTEEEMRPFVWPIVEAALPKMGICRNISLSLRYGSKRFGGVGLPNPVTFQGVSKLEYLLEHPWKSTPTGDLLRANYEAFLLECGFTGDIFRQDASLVNWLTVEDSWIQYAWSFLCTQKVTLDDMPLAVLPLKHENDVSIMQPFASRYRSANILRQLNACRMYLQVVSLADICTANGTRVHREFLFSGGKQPRYRPRRNTYDWPPQPCPPRTYWKTWVDCVTEAFTDGRGRLRQQLGEWTDPSDTDECEFSSWDWFVKDVDGVLDLCFYNGTTWTLYRPSCLSRTRGLPPFRLSGRVSHDPRCPGAVFTRASVLRKSNGFHVVASSSPLSPPPPPHLPSPGIRMDFSSFVTELSEAKEWRWMRSGHFEMEGSFDTLIRDLCAGRIVCVGDGSFFPSARMGAAAVSVESADGSSYIRCSCLVPGDASSHSAYRSELCGILVISVILRALTKFVPEFSPDISVVVGCDGKSALYRSLDMPLERLSTRYRQFDILAAIMGIWRDLPFASFPIHIKGHQDDDVPFDRLPRLAQMNVICDSNAKELLEDAVTHLVPSPDVSFSAGLPTVRCEGRLIVSELHQSIMSMQSDTAIQQYWCRRMSRTGVSLDSVSWSAFAKAYGRLHRPQQQFMTRWLSRQLHLNKSKRKWGSDSRCARCGSWENDLPHLLRCRASRDTVNIHLASIAELLVSLGTEPNLQAAIIHCLTEWFKQGQILPSNLSAFNRDVSSCFRHQLNTMGFYNFIQGFHHVSFLSIQQEHFRRSGSRRCAVVWQSKLIHALWQLIISVYDDREDAVSALRPNDDDTHPAVSAARHAALAELQEGRGDLPILYHQYFSLSEVAITSKGPADL